MDENAGTSSAYLTAIEVSIDGLEDGQWNTIVTSSKVRIREQGIHYSPTRSWSRLVFVSSNQIVSMAIRNVSESLRFDSSQDPDEDVSICSKLNYLVFS